jgi:hypothetical protein
MEMPNSARSLEFRSFEARSSISGKASGSFTKRETVNDVKEDSWRIS